MQPKPLAVNLKSRKFKISPKAGPCWPVRSFLLRVLPTLKCPLLLCHPDHKALLCSVPSQDFQSEGEKTKILDSSYRALAAVHCSTHHGDLAQNVLPFSNMEVHVMEGNA
jgi:hypothetical protein